MMNPILFFLSLTLLFHFHLSTTLAQSPAASPAKLPVPPAASPAKLPVPPAATPAMSPGPSGPADITKILEKSGHFALFLRLLKSTNVGETITSQLNNSNRGLTVFAPSDSAFSSLGLGTLNSLPDKEQIQLVQFHVLPIYFSTTQFQTVSNPLRTQAGENGPGQFPLNVTTIGNQEILSTGLMNTTISATLYTDNKLAVYQVDSVLLPYKLFGTSPAKTKTPVAYSPASDDSDAIATKSAAVSLTMHGMVVTIGVAAVASFLL